MDSKTLKTVNNVVQATLLAYDWLDSQHGEKNQNIENIMNNGSIVLKIDDLKEGVNAQTDGSAITLDEDYLKNADITQIAASIVHEATHLRHGGGDKTDEIRAEALAEKFRDEHNEGIFDNKQELINWANKNYSELPEDGVNIFS